MASLRPLLDYLENRFAREIRGHRTLDEVPAERVPLPEDLDTRLDAALRKRGIDRLYCHQDEAYRTVLSGQDAVLCSHTASGKTLAFLLPILDDYLKAGAAFSTMLFYPTKALSRDQEGSLGALMAGCVQGRRLGTFDGDTPREERQNLQRNADFVITNPDMLHAGILPNHNRRWKGFLKRLRYVVVDEVHNYRGAFGSHVSNVFRRFLRVCELHGSRPVFVCCSATVGNPEEHVRALFHRPFRVIRRDGAPRPRRQLYFVNPPLLPGDDSARVRKGPASVSIPLLREAAKLGIRTICFCRARQEVERLCRAVTDRHPELRELVQPYRGGLLPTERRRLERDLAEGRIRVVITTNALELGIDIGDLSLCVLSGHPGSIASFWQQAGRVGRKGKEAAIVYIAKDLPVDQYLVHHPEFVSNTGIEQAWLHADNPYILLQHLPCAAYEHPLRPREALFVGPAWDAALEVLQQDGTLAPYRDCWRYDLEDYPARGVNLRGMTDYNVEIHCGSEVIGEIDPIGARGTLYKDAIYQHLGRRYLSLSLDLEKKLCQVAAVEVDYYTEAVWEKRLEMTDCELDRELNGARLRYGEVFVSKQPKLFKKIRERSYENVGYGPITLEPFAYETTGLSLLPPAAWCRALEAQDKSWVEAALYGLSYLLHKTAPSLCMADVRDVESDVALDEGREPESWKSCLYLYDAHEGGVGYTEKIFERLEAALSLCLELLTACECGSGCPACVPPRPPGVESSELLETLIETDAARQCSASLLTCLLTGEIRLPRVSVVRRTAGPAVEPTPPDPEKLRLQRRLGRASRVLQRKRSRLH